MLFFGLLYAGLKPFHAPVNGITWVLAANALRFTGHAVVISSGFLPPSNAGDAARSFEISIQPGLIEDSNTIFAVFDPAAHRYFALCQAGRDLEVRIQSTAAWRREAAGKINIGDAFQDGRNAFWTVTFKPSGVEVYRDGALIRRSPLTVSQDELSGRLVAGTSPIFDDNWSGILTHVAIYDRALSAAQIARHFENWRSGADVNPLPQDACVALYRFHERSGRVIYNKAHPGNNNLYIPPKYMVLYKTVLDPVWRAMSWSRGFWTDAVINIFGFVPFGFCLCVYLAGRGLRRSVFIAAVLGGLVSLFIELAQVGLPTRDSSMADVINNLLGSILGTALSRIWINRGITYAPADLRGNRSTGSDRNCEQAAWK